LHCTVFPHLIRQVNIGEDREKRKYETKILHVYTVATVVHKGEQLLPHC